MKTDLLPLLKSVSRSFYLSLRMMPKNMGPALGLGYLFCRAADSVSDTELIPLEERPKALQKFKHLFKIFPFDPDPFENYVDFLRPLLPAENSAEKSLLKSLPLCAKALKNLSRTNQALVQEVVLGVIRGMEMDLKKFGQGPDNLKALKSEKELEDYLTAIGGEPGKFWTKLTLLHFSNLGIKNKKKWIDQGAEFGKGLQMVNILRDLSKDLTLGRCYLPETWLKNYDLAPKDLLESENFNLFQPLYEKTIDQTIHRLKHGLDYIRSLPRRSVRLRASVWWPLSIGLQTLQQLQGNRKVLDPKQTIKIKRLSIYLMMMESIPILPSNLFLRWDFEDLAGPATSSMEGKYVPLKEG